jgi:hypothetical protein
VRSLAQYRKETEFGEEFAGYFFARVECDREQWRDAVARKNASRELISDR